MEPQTNTISLLLSLSFVSASFMDLVESIIKSAYESQIGVVIVAKNNRYRQVVYLKKGFFANLFSFLMSCSSNVCQSQGFESDER
jgi:hypothetical protein